MLLMRQRLQAQTLELPPFWLKPAGELKKLSEWGSEGSCVAASQSTARV